jgi:hypothetical protein
MIIKSMVVASLTTLSLVYGCSEKASKNGDQSSQTSTQVSEAKGKYFSAKIVSWSVGPEVSGDSISDINNACIIEVTTPTGGIPDSLTVQDVFPYMKVHGHGAPDEQITYTIEGNRIKVSKIAFTMSGPWEIHVKATSNGQSEELEIPVVVP